MSVTSSPALVTGLTAGQSYVFTVTAAGGNGTTSAAGVSNQITMPTPAAAPATMAPTSVTATATSSSVARLAFTLPSGATGFVAQRDGTDSNGGGVYVSSVQPVSPSYVDFLSLIPGNTYHLGVQTVTASGSSAFVTVPVTMPTAAAQPAAITAARGVNAAGADFGSRASNTQGFYDSDASFAFYKARGLTMIRIPFLWERMQPTLNGALDTGELGRLTAAVNSATSRGMIANIDCHNYARYQPTANGTTNLIGDGTLSGANLADLWAKLANAFKGNSLVQFGIMNEPHDMTSSVWEAAGQAAVTAIRNTGATNWIWMSGNGYDSAAVYWGTHPNWFITDPLNRTGPEGHYYFDSDSSGNAANTYAGAVTAAQNKGYSSIGAMISADLSRFCQGAQSRGLMPYIGEMGWLNNGPDSASWNAGGEVGYEVLDAYGAAMTYWAAGEQWGSTYGLSAYTGTPQSATTGVSATIEAHPGLGTTGANLLPAGTADTSIGAGAFFASATAGTAPTLATDTAVKLAGAQSLKVTAAGTGTYYVGLTAKVAVTAGAKVSGLLGVRPATRNGYVSMQITWFDSTGAYLSNTHGVTLGSTTGQWLPLILSGVVAPAGAGFYSVQFNQDSAPTVGDVVNLDNFEVAAGAVNAWTAGVAAAPASTDYTSFATTAPVGPSGNFTLKASDDFTGTALDTAKWQPNRNGNDAYASPFNASLESEYFSNSQVSVANSLLTLTAVPDTSHSPATYRSGCVTADAGSPFRYTAPGTYSEARIRCPAVNGAWPAFWAVSDVGYTEEIDFLEILNGTGTQPSLTYHYGTNGGNAGSSSPSYAYGQSGTDYRGAFHTYGCLVTANTITAYLDGVAYQTISLPVQAIELEVTFDLALYSGYTIPSGTAMDVDWVRVWGVS